MEAKSTHKRQLIDELRELGSIIGMDENETRNLSGDLQASDSDLPILDDMVQASPDAWLQTTQGVFDDLAPLVKTVERGIVKPLTVDAEATEQESTASAAERAVDLVDTQMREKFGRSLPGDLADELWQILHDFLASRNS
ncbi:MAG: hypothetical protein ACNYPI_10110 [Arenicellales bacterium WSBS_2016_MAG_OTU3]